MSRGSCIKVHALKGSSGASNAENGLLNVKLREVKGQSFKDFSHPLTSQMGSFIYFWICDVKPTGWHGYFVEFLAFVTSVRIQLQSQFSAFFSELRISLTHPMLSFILDGKSHQSSRKCWRLWVDQNMTSAYEHLTFLVRVFFLTFYPVQWDLSLLGFVGRWGS